MHYIDLILDRCELCNIQAVKDKCPLCHTTVCTNCEPLTSWIGYSGSNCDMTMTGCEECFYVDTYNPYEDMDDIYNHYDGESMSSQMDWYNSC